MRHVTWLALFGVLLLGGCAWVSYKLIAPPGASFAVRLRDMRECHFEATRAVMSGEPRLRAQAKVPLNGRSTQRFIDGGAPVVDHRGNPAPWKSLLASYGSSEVSDRYILCLLGAGYRWENGATELWSE